MTSLASPQLIQRIEGQVVATHELPSGPHMIGRDPAATIRIDHPDVSRQHLQMQVDHEGMILRDLGSKNGVFVAGERLQDSVRLVHGDSFAIGGITFELSHPASQIDQALAAAGETTVTRQRTVERPPPRPVGLAWPILAVVVFALLLLATLLL